MNEEISLIEEYCRSLGREVKRIIVVNRTFTNFVESQDYDIGTWILGNVNPGGLLFVGNLHYKIAVVGAATPDLNHVRIDRSTIVNGITESVIHDSYQIGGVYPYGDAGQVHIIDDHYGVMLTQFLFVGDGLTIGATIDRMEISLQGYGFVLE